MDLVGLPLIEATNYLKDREISFTVELSRPFSRAFSVDDSQQFVIRQRQNADNSFCLLAAAKMGKEVFTNGL